MTNKVAGQDQTKNRTTDTMKIQAGLTVINGGRNIHPKETGNDGKHPKSTLNNGWLLVVQVVAF